MTATRKQKLILGSIVLILAIAAWAYYEHSLWEDVRGNPYIRQIKVDGKRVRVIVPDTNALHKVVDMAVFSDIRPGYSLKQAVDVFGEPHNVRNQDNGHFSLEYWRPLGRVEIVRQETASDVSMDVYAYPNNISYIDLLNRTIAKKIDPTREESIVVINDPHGNILMLVIIKGIRVDHLMWPY